jgi:hypothetical protein
MTISPEAIKKASVYDSDGKLLLKESIERLAAQLGVSVSNGTPELAPVVKKSRQQYADTTAKPVRDTVTGEEWPSQAKMAQKVRPGEMVKDGSRKNNRGCYGIYQDFPGRYEKLVDGVWVVQNPVKPAAIVPATTPATTSDAPASPLA